MTPIMTILKVEIIMKNNHVEKSVDFDKSYGVALSEKQLKFLVHCIEVAQESFLIKPDKEEMELIRRISRKHDELQDQNDFSNEYDSMMN